ncbi:hypothetical protein CcaverHIS002_0504140 [Cutaneotrichosporon cavernicola]|uniref:Uncharacterized protein n=1 Tax=Cutaneotrichosporon cavernicola TaxID=279322 RepID=A0AA48L6B4_9TREE|nr:uncharacterized protein CcaverHIS019_0504690 [Cutaneotrichosporon cavernicola]BEI85013.1 hypothetical protein CcaverHIS002_0504140 [Cutaneotrichosporon cavernicola]BEI92841.1 hypothetical protein CcaverHIS019_0504690 [Cutaneotrichosporon cavernicola]BEJ08384.1 hypothetical protein CcaverHIS641_0504690 [Cutaneotrichosporon cavernicola]
MSSGAKTEQPAPVPRTVLTTLYTHLTLSVGATTLCTLILARHVTYELLPTLLIVLPLLAGIWAASLAAFARSRSILKRALGFTTHTVAAALVSVILTLILTIAQPIFQTLLYPILARALLTLWSSVVATLVVIQTTASDSITHTRLAVATLIGGTISTLALAYLNFWAEVPTTILTAAVLHVLVIPDVSRLSIQSRADAVLAAHSFGSSWLLTILLRDDEKRGEKEDV